VRSSRRREGERLAGRLGWDDINEVADDEVPRRELAFVFCQLCSRPEFGENAHAS
jgi:hypothetical protein